MSFLTSLTPLLRPLPLKQMAAAAAAACVATRASAQASPNASAHVCGGSFKLAPGADSEAEQSLDLLRFGPPLGNVSGSGNGSSLRSITLSIPPGSSGMGGQQFWAYGKVGGECGMPGDRAESNGYTLFTINCDTTGVCLGAVPTELATAMACPLPPSAPPVVFAVLGAPGSKSAEVMYVMTPSTTTVCNAGFCGHLQGHLAVAVNLLLSFSYH